jgi:hypothetical protein
VEAVVSVQREGNTCGAEKERISLHVAVPKAFCLGQTEQASPLRTAFRLSGANGLDNTGVK